MIIDSHCHLLSSRYEKPINEIIDKCRKNNLSLLLNIATKETEFDEIINISKEYKEIYNSIGIHPHETQDLNYNTFDIINKIILNNRKTIAVGETGLDFYYNHSKKKDQIKSFENHIEIAIENNLPIIVHTREAEKDTKDILYSYKKNHDFTGIIHCFTGSEKFATEMTDIDFYISFSGIITFKNSSKLCDIIKNIDRKKLLVETDSPYLAPVPHRGKINMPYNIIHTISKLSELIELDLNETINLTRNNFLTLFKNIS